MRACVISLGSRAHNATPERSALVALSNGTNWSNLNDAGCVGPATHVSTPDDKPLFTKVIGRLIVVLVVNSRAFVRKATRPMKWLSLCVLVGISVCASACSSDDSENKDVQGQAGAGGSAGASAAGGAAGSATQGQPCEATGGGACRNETDCPKVKDGTANATSKSCGFKCIADASRATCVSSCFVETASMTAECSTCYGNLLDCVISNCVSVCAASSESPDCRSCVETAGCNTKFNTCSGLAPAN
jgi:hypothetical protein